MATSVARRAALPAGTTMLRAWGATMAPPRLCSWNERVEAPIAPPSPASLPQPSAEVAEALEAVAARQKASKSFQMHIGGALHIPTKNAQERPQMDQQPAQGQQAAVGIDPFEGMPFRAFAERMGEKIMPSLKAAREAEREAKLASFRRRAYPQEAPEVVIPPVPHVLPFTRWAASSGSFRSTFIADPPKERKKARMSWYHPDDTMVPRDWFRNGLLADLKYYSPFGLGGDDAKAEASTATA